MATKAKSYIFTVTYKYYTEPTMVMVVGRTAAEVVQKMPGILARAIYRGATAPIVMGVEVCA